MLVPTGESALEHNGLFVLTPTGAEMWVYLAEGNTFDELVAIMSEDYDVEAEVIRADAETLIQKLRDLGLIID
jgi:hypothetical protein